MFIKGLVKLIEHTWLIAFSGILSVLILEDFLSFGGGHADAFLVFPIMGFSIAYCIVSISIRLRDKNLSYKRLIKKSLIGTILLFLGLYAVATIYIGVII